MEWITAMQQAITYMEQKFIALVRNFQNETINDETNHDIPDFWDECHDKNLYYRKYLRKNQR